MKEYIILHNDDELYHHGIKGQRWGVRRFQNEDGSLTSAGRKHVGTKKGVLARTKTRMKYKAREKMDIHIKTKKAKGIGNKFSERFGYGAAATRARNRSQMQKELGEQSRTKLAQKVHSQRSANFNYQKEYFNKMQNASTGEKAFESLVFKKNYLDTPYQRFSGRTTTIGKEFVNVSFTYGVAGLIGDAKYKSAQKRAAKED